MEVLGLVLYRELEVLSLQLNCKSVDLMIKWVNVHSLAPEVTHIGPKK